MSTVADNAQTTQRPTVSGTTHTRPADKVSVFDSLVQAAAIVFAAAYWVSAFMAVVGIVKEHPHFANMITFDSKQWQQALKDIGFESILETWSTAFVVLLRWLAGMFGFCGTVNSNRELVIISTSLSLAYLMLKLPSTLLHLYAWMLTNDDNYLEKAKIDADIIFFDLVFISLCAFFAHKLSNRD